MRVLRVRNVHEALRAGLYNLAMSGVERQSRNGPVLQSPEPVTTVYEHPDEKVLFWPERDANPFFHFYESLWMLAGRNDVESMSRFAKNMTNYTDDGNIFHGAYGFRWRVGWSGADAEDQLAQISKQLLSDVTDRRCVLSMWNQSKDLGRKGKDVPCNTIATLQINDSGELDLCVFCRSNDIIWGCYGANAVQFGTLIEYMAARCGAKLGRYTQISVNWHGYRSTFDPLWAKFQPQFSQPRYEDNPYKLNQVKNFPLAQTCTPEEWDKDVYHLTKFKGRCPSSGNWRDPFFPDVAIPILKAHDAYKELEADNFEIALRTLESCQATDWRRACSEWIQRRWDKHRSNDAAY